MNRRYLSHLNTAVEILSLYDGKIPFHHFIREFLKLNKKYGSKDRKNISRLCYAGLRIGKAFPRWSGENKIRAGLFLCSDFSDDVTVELIGDYNEIITKDKEEKWLIISESYTAEFFSQPQRGYNVPENNARPSDADSNQAYADSNLTNADINHADANFNEAKADSNEAKADFNEANADSNEADADLNQAHEDLNQSDPASKQARTDHNEAENGYSIASIFPVPIEHFSRDLGTIDFLFSFFRQPDLFLRIRPGHEEVVVHKLNSNGIPFELLPPSAIRLAINTKLEEVLEADKEVVIQDYSSQLTASLLTGKTDGIKFAWDACAASGGKSLLIADLMPKLRLTVTDIRSSIIFNLEKRFQQAGIKNYHAFIVDLAGEAPIPFDQQQDLVIADVPCSGSGTWSRTPEQLAFFDPLKIGYYQDLQQRIVQRIVPQIRPGGYLLYITCSVFHEENEDNIDFISTHLDMHIVEQKLIVGHPMKADTLFAALLRKS